MQQLNQKKKVEDESDPLSGPNKDWVDYWRNLFPKVTAFKHRRCHQMFIY